MKNQHVILLFVIMITNSELLIGSNALRLQPSFSAHAHTQSLQDTNESEASQVLLQTLAETNEQLGDGPGTDAQTLTQAGYAVNGIRDVADSLKDNFKGKVSTFTNAVKKLTTLGGAFTALGAVFSLFDIILGADQKSDLDKITEAIANSERRIRQDIEKAVETLTLAARKSAFYEAETNIKEAAKSLKKMQASKGVNQRDFNFHRDQFKTYAKNTPKYILAITNAFETTFSNGEPLFELIMDQTDGLWSKVAEAVQVMTLWLLQAEVNYVAYLGLTKPNQIQSFTDDFQQKLEVITKYVATLPKKNFEVADQSIKDSLAGTISDVCDGDTYQCAPAVLEVYKKKYNGYLLFTVISYDEADYNDKTSILVKCQNCAIATQTQSKDTAIFYVMAGGCNQLRDTYLSARLDKADFTNSVAKNTAIKQEFYSHLNLHPGFATSYQISTYETSNYESKVFLNYLRMNAGWDYLLDQNSLGPCFWVNSD